MGALSDPPGPLNTQSWPGVPRAAGGQLCVIPLVFTCDPRCMTRPAGPGIICQAPPSTKITSVAPARPCWCSARVRSTRSRPHLQPLLRYMRAHLGSRSWGHLRCVAAFWPLCCRCLHSITVAAFASLVDAFSLWPVPVASLRRLVGIPGLAPSGVRTIANRDMPASAFGDRCGATITRHTN